MVGREGLTEIVRVACDDDPQVIHRAVLRYLCPTEHRRRRRKLRSFASCFPSYASLPPRPTPSEPHSPLFDSPGRH